MQEVIEEEFSIGDGTREELQGWVDDPDTLDEDALIALIERVGKGRFAQALARHVAVDTCSDYIRQPLVHIRTSSDSPPLGKEFVSTCRFRCLLLLYTIIT